MEQLGLHYAMLCQSLEIIRLSHSCSCNVVEDEAHSLCVGMSPLQFLCVRDRLPSLFQNVVLESLEPFYRLDQEVDMNRYLTEATALAL